MKRYFRVIIAVLSISLPISAIAQYNEQRVFEYLETTYNTHDKYLLDVLITELDHYMRIFPDGTNAARVQQMLAKVYEEKGKEDEAIASYLKMFCLYPDVANVAGNTDALRQLVANERSYEKKKDWLFGVLDQSISSRPLADGYYHYLSILVELEQSGLADWVLDECRNFHEQFSNDPRNEQVVRWMGDTYLSKRNYREATVIFSKYAYLFPDNPLVPNILYKQADIIYEKLRDEEKAAEILNQLVADYPGDEIMPEALFLRGQILSKEQKKYQEAIADYRQLVDNYPDNPKIMEALERMVDINEDELKDYQATINVLNEIVEKSKEEEKGIKALEDIANIYDRQLKDHTATAETYARIADQYPNYEKAPERLIDAGEICEKELNDYQKAISYYQMVIDKFPTHDKVDDARKKIEDAQKKLTEN